MQLRVLFFDDDADRHTRVAGFWRDMHLDVQLDHAYTVSDAIDRLRESTRPYDVVCLDHDLDLTLCGDGEDIPPDESGYDVASYIGLHMERARYPRLVIIHSWNSEGARRMAAALQPTGIPVVRKPFSSAPADWRLTITPI